jgi:hypothetical protein
LDDKSESVCLETSYLGGHAVECKKVWCAGSLGTEADGAPDSQRLDLCAHGGWAHGAAEAKQVSSETNNVALKVSL